MESEHKKPQLKMGQELDQDKSPKKSLWKKIKELIRKALERRASEEWRAKDLDDW